MRRPAPCGRNAAKPARRAVSIRPAWEADRREIRSEIRGDHVLWIDESQAGPALKAILEKLEALRQAVNQSLFLGLFDVELHFAVYPPAPATNATSTASATTTGAA
jgi:hypothetical protein